MEIEPVETKDYEFYWNIAKNGYEVVDNTRYKCPVPNPPGPTAEYYPYRIFFFPESLRIETSQPWLIAKRSRVFHPDTVYKPLSNPVLHRKFASLKTENLEAEVLSFAGKYGLLGQKVILHSVTPAPPEDGESLRCWRREIDKMGVLLAIWDWVRKNEVGKLGQAVLWPNPDSVVVRFKWRSLNGKYEILPWDKKDYIAIESTGEYPNSDYAYTEDVLANGLASHGYSTGIPLFGAHKEKLSALGFYVPWFLERYRRGDVTGPGRHYVCHVLNHHLEGITPHLVADLGYKVAFIPKTLLDALWLMFMLEVNGVTRTCWYCGGPLEPTRKDNVYCSGNCKRMAYYYNKQRKGGTP